MLLKMPQGLSNCTLYTHTHTHRHFSGSSQAPGSVSNGLSVTGSCLGLLMPNGSRQKHLEHLIENSENNSLLLGLAYFQRSLLLCTGKGVKAEICGEMGHLFLSLEVQKMLLKLNSILDTRKIKVQNEPALTSRTFSSICDCDFVLSLTWPTELRDKRQIKGNALKSFPRAIYPQLAHGAVWLPQNYHSIQFNQCALRGLKINY